jgi:hypothetical protein
MHKAREGGECCAPYEGHPLRGGLEVQTVNWNANDVVHVDPFRRSGCTALEQDLGLAQTAWDMPVLSVALHTRQMIFWSDSLRPVPLPDWQGWKVGRLGLEGRGRLLRNIGRKIKWSGYDFICLPINKMRGCYRQIRQCTPDLESGSPDLPFQTRPRRIYILFCVRQDHLVSQKYQYVPTRTRTRQRLLFFTATHGTDANTSPTDGSH